MVRKGDQVLKGKKYNPRTTYRFSLHKSELKELKDYTDSKQISLSVYMNSLIQKDEEFKEWKKDHEQSE